MKINQLSKFLVLTLILGFAIFSSTVSAQNEIIGNCPAYFDPVTGGNCVTNGDEDACYLTMDMDEDGNFILKIYGVPGNTETDFRNSDGLQVENFTVEDVTFTVERVNEVTRKFIPSEPLNGKDISYTGFLLYRTAYTNYVTQGNVADLYPTVSFTYDGSKCDFQQTKYATPTISNIDNNKKITFSSVSGRNMVYVYRGGILAYSQEVDNNDVINFVPVVSATYIVRLQAKSNDINFVDSEMSAEYEWPLEAEGNIELEPSEYCWTPVTIGGYTILYKVETLDNGDIHVEIAGYLGDPQTYFRAAGWQNTNNNIKVNGTVVDFTKTDGEKHDEEINGTVREVFSEFTLTPNAELVPGDVISYIGTTEFTTSTDNNAYGTITIDYTYGSNCDGLPVLEVDPQFLTFTPNTESLTFTLKAENLAGDIFIQAPKGLSVAPSSITPGENGNINAAQVTVKWMEGTSSGTSIYITGGGLLSSVPVMIQTEDFSNYCNKIINQNANGRDWPAYLNVSMNEENTEMYFDIEAVNENEVATWNNIANIRVNAGENNEEVLSKTISDDKTQVLVIFKNALQPGDEVEFGNALVWTIENTVTTERNGNTFINGWQPAHVVGLNCDLEDGRVGTGVDNVSGKEIILYPNPAVDYIYFSTEVKEVNIYSLQGQKVLSDVNTGSVNISALAKGLYVIKATDNTGKEVSSKIEIR